MIGRIAGLVMLVLTYAIGEAGAQVIAPTAPVTAGPPAKARLGRIGSWGYQLQRIDPDLVAKSPYDVMVVDYSTSGQEVGRLTSSDIQRMQTRPDGTRRVVLAYLSIGEAEDYRYYWRQDWVEAVLVLDDAAGIVRPPNAAAFEPRIDRSASRPKLLRLPKLGAPSWLGRENESWPTNFFVRFWDPAWQNLILGKDDSYLSRILSAGFDGVYLDRVDAFQAVGPERPEARSEMVRFVVALAERARREKPGFLVVPQNGEQLLSDPSYLAVIDAVAKEDLFYGEEADGQRNPLETVARSMRWLAPAMNRGLPVLVVEYVREPALVESLRAEILGRGFLPYFGVRALDRLVLPGDLVTAPLTPERSPVTSSDTKTVPPAAAAPPSPSVRKSPDSNRERPVRRTAPRPQRTPERSAPR